MRLIFKRKKERNVYIYYDAKITHQ